MKKALQRLQEVGFREYVFEDQNNLLTYIKEIPADIFFGITSDLDFIVTRKEFLNSADVVDSNRKVTICYIPNNPLEDNKPSIQYIFEDTMVYDELMLDSDKGLRFFDCICNNS